MHTLTRRVRMTLNPPDAPSMPVGSHGYAGVPTPVGLGAHYEFAVTVGGTPDARTGYVLDIKAIDDAARAALFPALTRASRAACAAGDPAGWLAGAAIDLKTILPTLRAVRVHVSPFLSYEVAMPTPASITIRQRFDFAAAHRLHVPELSAEQNRALFGKCNNLRGHGHNYQFEPAIAVPAGSPIAVGAIEETCKRVLLDRFDHKHLNEDCAEFDVSRGGVNPSVENIARVFFELLAPAVAALPGARLSAITVWETDRTNATYPA